MDNRQTALVMSEMATKNYQHVPLPIPVPTPSSALPQTAHSLDPNRARHQPFLERVHEHDRPVSSEAIQSTPSQNECATADAIRNGQHQTEDHFLLTKSWPSKEASGIVKPTVTIRPEDTKVSRSHTDNCHSLQPAVACSRGQSTSDYACSTMSRVRKRQHGKFESQLDNRLSKQLRREVRQDSNTSMQVASCDPMVADAVNPNSSKGDDKYGDESSISCESPALPQKLDSYRPITNASVVESSDSSEQESLDMTVPVSQKQLLNLEINTLFPVFSDVQSSSVESSALSQKSLCSVETVAPKEHVDKKQLTFPSSNEVPTKDMDDSLTHKEIDRRLSVMPEIENICDQSVSDYEAVTEPNSHGLKSSQSVSISHSANPGNSDLSAFSNCAPSHGGHPRRVDSGIDCGAGGNPLTLKSSKDSLTSLVGTTHDVVRSHEAQKRSCLDIGHTSQHSCTISSTSGRLVSDSVSSFDNTGVSLRSAPVLNVSIDLNVHDYSPIVSDDLDAETVPENELPSPPQRSRKQVRWAPDDKLSDICYIDTRLQLIQNWDPDSEVTLPFSASTLAQLRALLRAEKDATPKEGNNTLASGAPGLRSAPIISEFELAKRRERDMELERTRQAKQELQSRLNSMSPTRTWSAPAAIILPSECKVDSDDCEVRSQKKISWMVSDSIMETSSSPQSPRRKHSVQSGNPTISIPLTDSATTSVDRSGKKNLQSVEGIRITCHLERNSSQPPFAGNRMSSEKSESCRGKSQLDEPLTGRRGNVDISDPSVPCGPQRLKLVQAVPFETTHPMNSQLNRTMPLPSAVAVQKSSELPIPSQALQQLLNQMSCKAQNPEFAEMSTAGPPPFPLNPVPLPQMGPHHAAYGMVSENMMGMPAHNMMFMPPPPSHVMGMSPTFSNLINNGQHPSSHPSPFFSQLAKQHSSQNAKHVKLPQSQQTRSQGSRGRKVCRFFNTKQGCRDGPNCIFLHIPSTSNSTSE